MKPVCDHFGNEIKEGMVIRVIETEPFFSKITPIILNLGTGERKQVGETINFPDKCWNIKAEYKIISLNGKLYYETKTGEMTWNVNLSMLYFGLQTSDIVTIKGISDVCVN